MHESLVSHDRIPRVLLAEDDEETADAVAHWLRRSGYEVFHVTDGRRAVERLHDERFDLLLLDLTLPRLDGWGVLERLRELRSAPPVVVLAHEDEAESAVRAMRLGALSYVAKPSSIERLIGRLGRALDTATLRRSIHGKLASEAEPMVLSPAMQHVQRLAARVAKSPHTPVLILGESGSGKEVLASFIHARSPRAAQPFVRVNLAALPPTTIEAELFGATRGAFTGSYADRPGLVASAGGGTLLLDELCEFDIALQAKLLRLVEQRSFFPVGSDRERHVDVRLLAATNVEPDEAMRDGRLRPDLYYRLSAMTLRLPPLRERREDIVPLARVFLGQQAQELGRSGLTLSREAERVLLRHAWPGNVRQLRNAIERAALLCDGAVVGPDDLALEAEPTASPLPAAPEPARERLATVLNLEQARQRTVEAVERACIRQALESGAGSTTRAARLLGISRSTLWAKLRRYGMEPSEASGDVPLLPASPREGARVPSHVPEPAFGSPNIETPLAFEGSNTIDDDHGRR